MKRLHVLSVVAAVALVATAPGQVLGGGIRTVEFAHGEGILHGRDNAQARIAFRVGQEGDRPAEGMLRFTTVGPNGGTLVIETSRIPRLEAREDGATFGGPALLSVSGRDGFRWEGNVVVTVRNNMRIQVGREWRIVDVVEVKFTTDRTDRTYSFAGQSEPRNFDTGIRRG